jgi:hypothetical protein
MRLYTLYLLLQTALHVSGSDATHHQEHVQLHSQHLVLVVVSELLPPAIGVRYTGCPRRNMPDFVRVFLMLKYTDITQNTYIQS